MELDKLVTIGASLIGAFWIVLQIITHVTEKGTRHALTALAIVVLAAAPVFWWLRPSAVPSAPAGGSQAPVTPAAPPSALALAPHERPVPAAPAPPRAGTPAARTPAPGPSSPALASPAALSPPEAAPSDVATPAPSPSQMTPPTQAPAPGDGQPSPPPLQAGFQVVMARNLVGGIARVQLHCTFTSTGPVTVTGYTVTVHVQGRGDGEPRDHVFDRVLDTPMAVMPGKPMVLDVPVDPEVGDLLVAYRRNASPGWVHLTWKGLGPAGEVVQVESGDNEEKT